MTTAVRIECPSPNHKRIRVIEQHKLGDSNVWADGAAQEMQHGEAHVHYIHTHRRLIVEEID